MNNPSPLTPESPVAGQKNQSRVRVRTAVTLVFGVNIIALMVLLIIGFGCRKPSEPELPPPDTTAQPTFDTNAAPMMDTNAPATNVTAYVPPVPEPVVTPSAAQEYVIVKGDTFEKIAKDHGVSTKAIQDANPGVDARRLKIGQKINLPAPSTAVSAPAAGALAAGVPAVVEATAGGEQIHKVKSGDTLTAIAKHYGVSVRALRSANSLTTDKIKVGDKLKIPAKPAASAVPDISAPAGTVPKPL